VSDGTTGVRLRRLGRRARISAVSGVVVVAAAAGAFGATAASASSARPAGGHCSPSVRSEPFGSAYDSYAKKNLPVYRYTLSSCHGMTAKILTYGGIVQEINAPGRDGKQADVVLGFKTLADYIKDDSPPVTANGGPYFGETVGRYANRIAKGTFKLNGKTYTVPVNNGVNSLHGGLVGFGSHVWAAQAVHGNGSAGVQLTLNSPNADQSYPAGSPGCPNGCTGYPAALKVVVTFTISNGNALGIHYQATNESKTLATVLNLTNHSYFNLAGEGSPAGSAYSQQVQINADTYSPTDTTQIPLGDNVPVAGTPFDFRSPHTIGSRIDDVSAPDNAPAQYNQLLIAQGYDHNWVLNKQTAATTGPDGLNLAAHAWDPASGRELTVWTDQPGVQFYSGNFLTGTLVGISGHTYRQGAGYTFETQHFPDSPNHPDFPSTVLGAGKTFSSATIFQFSS
jgi:aldose 1-epimerase